MREDRFHGQGCRGGGTSGRQWDILLPKVPRNWRERLSALHQSGRHVVRSDSHCRSTETSHRLSRYGDDKRFEFRREQLEQRRFEIYAAVDVLKKLSVDGDHRNLSTIDDSEVDWSDFQGKIRFDALQLTGHSFGAATLFSLLSHEPPDGFAPLPVTHALFLDPWLEPFEKLSLVQAGKNSQVKKVILHSEGFTLWRSHMAQVVGIAKDWGNVPIYTIGRLSFISESDSHTQVMQPGQHIRASQITW